MCIYTDINIRKQGNTKCGISSVTSINIIDYSVEKCYILPNTSYNDIF